MNDKSILRIVQPEEIRAFSERARISLLTCTDGKNTAFVATYDHLQSHELLDHEDIDELIKLLKEYKRTFTQKVIEQSKTITGRHKDIPEPAIDFDYLFEHRKKTRTPKPGYIYLIQRGNEQRYKIGHSVNPFSRLRALQTASDKILLLAQKHETHDMKGLEDTLHLYFTGKRHCGEWFTLNSDDLDSVVRIVLKFNERGDRNG